MEQTILSEVKMNWNLKKRITEKFGLQWKFAFEVGEQEAIVSKVINGRYDLKPAKQQKWAQALDCKVEDIF
jgi:hypothetical protein